MRPQFCCLGDNLNIKEVSYVMCCFLLYMDSYRPLHLLLTFSISVSFTFCFSCFLWSGLYFILLGRQVAVLHSCRTWAQLASLCHDPAPLQCNDDCPVPHLRLQASLARSEVFSSIPQKHASISQYVCLIIWQSETLHFTYLDFCINSS